MGHPLRILHVFSTFGPGGPQVRTCDLMNRLGPGFSHVVMAVDGQTGARSRIDSGVNCQIASAPAGKGSLKYPLAFYRVLRKARPDLLVTYNWGAFDAVMAGALSSICPVLHAEDGFGPDESNGLKRRRVWLRRLFLNALFGVVVPSKTLLKVATGEYRTRPEKVHWIANGVDVDRFQPGRNMDLRRKWGVSDESVLFGYTGRLAAEKNLPLLIRGFAEAKVPHAKLAIVGPGLDRVELEALSRSLGVEQDVIFTGLVEDVAGWYTALDVFVMSSLTEQMPMSLLEAMACGLPAICTDVGDCAEVLGNPGSPAIVPSGDVAGYAESMRAFGGNPALRRQAGLSNRALCAARFSAGQMVFEYASLYRAAARSTPAVV